MITAPDSNHAHSVTVSMHHKVARDMRILIKLADGDYQVEVVGSREEASARCLLLGAHWWNHIGWQEAI